MSLPDGIMNEEHIQRTRAAMSSTPPTVGPYTVKTYHRHSSYVMLGERKVNWFAKEDRAIEFCNDLNAAYALGQASREQSAQPQQPVAMIHNDYDASVACSNCGTDGGFSTYDDLDWAKRCPGCGRPISEQVDAKGNRTPHPLYAAPVPSQQPSVSVEEQVSHLMHGAFAPWYRDSVIPWLKGGDFSDTRGIDADLRSRLQTLLSK